MTRQLNILLVEDNPGDAELVRVSLSNTEQTDFDVTGATLLSDALSKLESDEYGVVLLDLGLPDSSGIDTLKSVRDAVPGVPVVVLTGNDDEATGVAAIEVGAQDYLVKGQAPAPVLVRSVRHAIERKQAEEKIASLNERLLSRAEELGAANRELELLSYSISHDIRGPLMTIDGFAQVLQTDCEPPRDSKAAEYVDRIRSSVRRVEELLDDLLDLSRAGRLPLEPEDLDLTQTAREISDRLLACTPDRAVELAIADGVRAIADKGLIASVLENLLGNAFKFTSRHETARIEFGVFVAGETPVYYIADDGAGFDPKRSSELFEAFGRLHEASEFRGTGLGLASVKRVVKRHGGDVWAEGDVERGATFYFTLGAPRPAKSASVRIEGRRRRAV